MADDNHVIICFLLSPVTDCIQILSCI